MKKGLSLVLAAAMLAAIVPSSSSGDYIKVKREYRTPFGKVKIKEYRRPASYYPVYCYGPPYAPASYGWGSCCEPPAWSVPAYWYSSPYCGPWKVEIDD